MSHIALLPSSGMGHLTPFLRLAAVLAADNLTATAITIITPYPTLSSAESLTLSYFFTTFPQIRQELLHLDDLSGNLEDDPFYHHIEVIRQSSHHLSSLLASLSPPVTALITDMSLTASVIPITKALNIHNYIFFTSSAKMLTLFISFHSKDGNEFDEKDALQIRDLKPIHRSWIPPPLLQDSNNLLKTYISENGKEMIKSDGILVNTLECIEQESLAALNDGRILPGLPSVTAVGLLPPCFEKEEPLEWLDKQPTGSVLYVSFGSRTAMSREQLRELGDGLVKSGHRFLWVVKDKQVDREDDKRLEDIIGIELMESVKGRGLVVKHWLNQESVLSHPAVGGFLSHCGWNSLTEAMLYGVPVLAWPQHGDQKINAAVVKGVGLGMWEKRWGWGGKDMITGQQIAETVCELMRNDSLRMKAECIQETCRAVGTSAPTKILADFIQMLKIDQS